MNAAGTSTHVPHPSKQGLRRILYAVGRSMLRPYKEHRPMRPPAITMLRFLRYSLAVLVITLAGNSGILRAQQKTGLAQEKPKIRAITAFINLDRAQHKEQVADALKMLRRG